MRNRKPASLRRRPHRRSFTLVELILAGVITAFVLGSISTVLSNLAQAKRSSRQRLEAHLRADTALEMIRRDVVALIRTDDLFFTRFLLVDNTANTPLGKQDRDELLLFSNRLRQLRNIEYNGEGTEFEVQYRVEEGDVPTLWQRRDPFPDEYPRGGGVATPMVDSIVGFRIEAYDGFQWFEEWDSDYEGIPRAVRITVTAGGDTGDTDVYESPIAVLRTVVAFDRILLPRQNIEALFELEAGEEEADDGTGATGAPTSLDDLGIDPSLFGPGGGRLELGPDEGVREIINGPQSGGRRFDPMGSGSDTRAPITIRPGTSPSQTGGRRGGGG